MEEDTDQADVVNHPSDAELVARANAGDAAAFEMLYLHYRDWVMQVALRFCRGDRNLALDVVQETFLQWLRKFPRFVLTAQLKTYLYPVIRHTALAMARQHRHGVDVNASHDPTQPPRESLSGPDLAALHAAIDQLDAGQREVLLLRFADDLSLQEIALAMQIPLGTVKSRLHNALATLRQNSRLQDFFQFP